MQDQEKEFLERLRATFKGEAEEHLGALSAGLLELEKKPGSPRQRELIEQLLREAHSLKGAARAVNLGEVSAVCQSWESLFAAAQRGEAALAPPLFDLGYQVVDALGAWVSARELSLADKTRAIELVQRLDDAARGLPAAAAPARATPPPTTAVAPSAQAAPAAAGPVGIRELFEKKPAFAETVRVPTAKLDLLLNEAEELISAKLSAQQRRRELRLAQAQLGLWQKEWSRREPDLRQMAKQAAAGHPDKSGVAPEKLGQFFDASRERAGSLEECISDLLKAADEDCRAVGVMVDTLLEDAKKILMLPLSLLLQGFPRLVRDLAAEQGKEVQLTINGEDIEIDKRILQELKDPLIHLIRNCVDHGIEKPEVRLSQGKPRQGQVTISAAQKESNQVEIEIADDGAGFDLAKVKAAAVKAGIAAAGAETLTAEETARLAMHSGVSTSPIVTDISGRGLGLAIVREKVEKAGGRLELATRPGEGTRVTLSLALRLATYKGILVKAGGRLFVVPAADIDQLARIPRDEVKAVEKRETIELYGQALPLFQLQQILELSREAAGDGDWLTVMVLGRGEELIAFTIDEVLGEQEVLIKDLGRQLARVRNIAGATVLGNGELVPILNPADLLKSAARAARAPAGPAPLPEVEASKFILLADDSITARTLIKNILEAAGYRVKTAVNGLDAFQALQQGGFDLLVTDIQMPQMDGFALTEAVRADKHHADLPVVLVTGLEAVEDRKRGIEVGADAYIIKSTFDQSNLLEVIKRLI